jgi:hypothetical protein
MYSRRPRMRNRNENRDGNQGLGKKTDRNRRFGRTTTKVKAEIQK